tara:strand:+ start:2630 stop:3349 length:720 start_codon:yes stop_codon:yes gene_type:complete
MNYIFDVDGTLTPSRGKIDPQFEKFMVAFAGKFRTYLVTGSDRQKTIDQIGESLYYTCNRVYNCSGSDVYCGSRNVYRDDWTLPKDVENFLLDELAYSCFPIRNGVHIEHRPGTVNFSILGRGKDPKKGREEYKKWDKERLERQDIADRIRNQFPDLYVALGGETGLDIAPKGGGKEQILRDFYNEIVFYGDKMDKGGNDYSLAHEIRERKLGTTYHVYDYKHTWELLQYETAVSESQR